MVLVDPILEIAMHEFGDADSPGVFDGRQAVFFPPFYWLCSRE